MGREHSNRNASIKPEEHRIYTPLCKGGKKGRSAMIKEISRDDLKRALDNSEIEYLFDARDEESYEKAHILGADSLPAANAEHGVGLPANKAARIVFYCDEPT
jgi:hypothetical protein